MTEKKLTQEKNEISGFFSQIKKKQCDFVARMRLGLKHCFVVDKDGVNNPYMCEDNIYNACVSV